MRCLIFLTLIFLISSKCPFPKTIWMYWNQSEQKLPLVPRLCYTHLKKHAANNGFNLKLLNEENLSQYITNLQQFRSIVKKSKNNCMANYADFIRLTILEEHGGIWIDITTILLEDFDWLNNLQKQQEFLSNQYGLNSQDPQILLFYNKIYGYRVKKNYQNNKLINQLPGYQSWFIAAKKNASLIKDWKTKFIQYYLSDYLQIVNDLSQNQIYIHHFGKSPYYKVFYAVYFVLQQKQKQLDKRLTFFKGQRQNSNLHYRVWGIDCKLGPCLSYMQFSQNWNQFSKYTIDQLRHNFNQFRYFSKLDHRSSIRVKAIIQNSIFLFKQNKTLKQSFQIDLIKYPNFKCSEKDFIVENSILHKLMKDNPKQNVKIITLQERQEWLNYCNQQQSSHFSQIPHKQILSLIFAIIVFIIIINQFSKNKEQKLLTINEENYPAFMKIKIFFFQFSNILYTLLIYEAIQYAIYLDYQNTKNQLFKSLIFVTIFLGFDNITQKSIIYLNFQLINQKNVLQKVYLLTLKKIIKINSFLKIFGYFSIAKICLNLIQNRPQNMALYSILLGVIGPYTLNLGLELAQISGSKVYKRILHFIQGKHTILIIMLLSLINLFPNFLFLVQQENSLYLARDIIYFVFGYLITIIFIIFYQFMRQRSSKKIKRQFIVNFGRQFMIIGLALNCSILYILIYYHRLLDENLRYNFQVCFCMIFAFMSSKNHFQRKTKNKIMKILYNQQNVLIYARKYPLTQYFEQFSVSFLVILSFLIPLEFYFNQYPAEAEQSDFLIEIILNYFIYIFLNVSQFYLAYELFSLFKNIKDFIQN